MLTHVGRPRPSRAAVCGWFLLAVVMRQVLKLAFVSLIRLCAGFGLDVRAGGQVLYDLTFQLGILALPVMIALKNRSEFAGAMRLNRGAVSARTFAAIAGVAFVPCMELLAGWWALMLRAVGAEAAGTLSVPDGPFALIMALLTSCALPALCEEFFFRGAILAGWEGCGSRKAVLIAALAFAAVHGSVTGFPVQLTMGLALGWLAVRSDSVMPAVIAHAAYNAATLLLKYFADFDLSRAVVNLFAYPEARWLLAADTAACAVLGALMLFGFGKLTKNRGAAAAGLKENQPTMDSQDIIILFAGVFTALVIYASDALSLFGVI